MTWTLDGSSPLPSLTLDAGTNVATLDGWNQNTAATQTWTLDANTPTLDVSASIATLDGAAHTNQPPTLFFSWIPSYASPRKTAFKQRSANFGDGYSQRTGIGINNIGRTWDLRFNGKKEAVALAIGNFLDVRKNGESFSWTPPFLNPNSVPIKVICASYDIVPSTFGSFDVTATFIQVFGE